jgi:hypothetical protein
MPNIPTKDGKKDGKTKSERAALKKYAIFNAAVKLILETRPSHWVRRYEERHGTFTVRLHGLRSEERKILIPLCDCYEGHYFEFYSLPLNQNPEKKDHEVPIFSRWRPIAEKLPREIEEQIKLLRLEQVLDGVKR